MARYIDADKINADFIQSYTANADVYITILKILGKAPTADVVEVVRCGKCRKRNTEKCWCSQWEDDYETGFDENGFCSGGKRNLSELPTS